MCVLRAEIIRTPPPAAADDDDAALYRGEKTSGQDVRSQNVTAACAIANIVKVSTTPPQLRDDGRVY